MIKRLSILSPTSVLFSHVFVRLVCGYERGVLNPSRKRKNLLLRDAINCRTINQTKVAFVLDRGSLGAQAVFMLYVLYSLSLSDLFLMIVGSMYCTCMWCREMLSTGSPQPLPVRGSREVPHAPQSLNPPTSLSLLEPPMYVQYRLTYKLPIPSHRVLPHLLPLPACSLALWPFLSQI